MKDITKHHDKMLAQLSPEILEKSVRHLKKILTIESVNEIRKKHSEDPDTWWADAHFGWGMAIRNFLRDSVCLDNMLPPPNPNWDDYYVPLVEIACGIRHEENPSNH